MFVGDFQYDLLLGQYEKELISVVDETYQATIAMRSSGQSRAEPRDPG